MCRNPQFVIPAQAGIQYFCFLDSRLRGNDRLWVQTDKIGNKIDLGHR